MEKDKGYGLLWILAAQVVLPIFFLVIVPRLDAEGFLYRSAMPVVPKKVLSKDDNGSSELKYGAGHPYTEPTRYTTSVSDPWKNYASVWEVGAPFSQATGIYKRVSYRTRSSAQCGYHSSRSPTYGVTAPAITRNRWTTFRMRPYADYIQYYLVTFENGTRTWALVNNAITRVSAKGRVVLPVGYYRDKRTAYLLADKERKVYCVTDRNVLEDSCLGNALGLYSG